ncbi:MAG: polysaccharide biosynthesis/export family protein [Verrucomicrobia bacterium]|nr:polysaccharide biosynthesis/export family protein [Verrucomicrobiota bacterium]
MNDESNVNGELPDPSASGRSPGRARGNGHRPPSEPKAPQFGAADLLPFVNALGQHWRWLWLGGTAMALIGLLSGLWLWKPSYTASAQLLRQASAQVMEVLGDRELDPNTYASVLRAPELVQRVAAHARPPVTPEWLDKRLNITPERNSDLLLIAVSTGDRQGAVDLANLYAREAVGFMQELQTNAAARARILLAQQLAPIEAEISSLNKATQPAAARRAVAARSPLLDKLPAAQLELADLLARYTELHPLVREQQAKVAAIESQLRLVPATPPTAADIAEEGSAGPIGQDRDPVVLQTKLQSLENARLALLGQMQAALSLETQPPGTCRILAPATFKAALPHTRTAKVAVLAGFGGMIGLFIVCALILLAEAVDPRLKTAADVQRVTRLPVVATAGDLAHMTEAEQSNWAFRAWTSLQRLLSPSSNQGFVCGITSSESGEGRSTWIRLLAEEASQRGFRVLTIIARPPEHNGKAITGQSRKAITDSALAANDTSDLEALVTRNGNGALTATHVLNTPDEVTQKLIGPNPEPVVEIPLPGWVWNLERRKQWHAALRHWSQIDSIALLVELPPASLPETVLLAENLPNVIWLADGEKATAARTREQLETLRNARCHLAGAVLNRAPVPVLTNRFARWLGCAALICGLPGWSAYGQEGEVQSTNKTAGVANPNRSLSVVTPAQRAAWQERLTLGPGDVVTLALWGEPVLTRTEVAVGPDGRISFAEAQDVLATGLTLDELRVKLDEELGKYRRAPQTMITPVAFRSKKYYVLGRVTMKGVYVLDRPITLLEAVARAHGFETGLVDRNIITVADFSRSFLMRKGERMPLNFESLFQNGDLSQNLSIEPGDYLYFPGANVKEVYVVGEVRLPGSTPYTTGLTLMGAITARAGYTERAYKGRVLVVRGSLNKPETFAVETKDILAGKVPDFRLQPKDIIFVNSRPFIYGEELADLAITVFLQSLVSVAVGQELIYPFPVSP